jgi:hypothetical protein
MLFSGSTLLKEHPVSLLKTINGELALVNGAPITMHSLTFSTKQEHDIVRERIMRGDFKYGDEIVIDIDSLMFQYTCTFSLLREFHV